MEEESPFINMIEKRRIREIREMRENKQYVHEVAQRRNPNAVRRPIHDGPSKPKGRIQYKSKGRHSVKNVVAGILAALTITGATIGIGTSAYEHGKEEAQVAAISQMAEMTNNSESTQALIEQISKIGKKETIVEYNEDSYSKYEKLVNMELEQVKEEIAKELKLPIEDYKNIKLQPADVMEQGNDWYVIYGKERYEISKKICKIVAEIAKDQVKKGTYEEYIGVYNKVALNIQSAIEESNQLTNDTER